MFRTGQLNNVQHGYLEKKSTVTALFNFCNEILKSLEQNDIPLGLFLDLSKAYDTLNYDILLIKLQYYGFRDFTLKWFESYLSNRKQVVILKNCNGVKSESDDITLGIPQGSVIGPILFLVYINDILEITENINYCNIVTYADDTNLLIKAKNMPELLDRSREIIDNANIWFNKNQLILNKTKTKIIFFQTKRTNIQESDIILTDDTHLTPENNVKFLGLYLDKNLSWSLHVKHVVQKISRSVYNLRILKRYLDFKTLKSVYHAIFESNIRYGMVIYGSTNELHKIFLVQKKALRVMLGMKIRESCRNKFKENNILTVTAILIQECTLFFFKNKNLFNIDKPQIVYNTRHSDYNYPVHRLKLTELGPYYYCLKLFNNLPDYMKQIDNIVPFKNHLYKFLIDLEPYNLKDYLSVN